MLPVTSQGVIMPGEHYEIHTSVLANRLVATSSYYPPDLYSFSFPKRQEDSIIIIEALGVLAKAVNFFAL